MKTIIGHSCVTKFELPYANVHVFTYIYIYMNEQRTNAFVMIILYQRKI